MARKPNPVARQRILEQAEHLIHLSGYQGTSMDDISRALGMNKANLYHHFGSKKALALAVLDWKMDEYRKGRVEPLCAKGDPLGAVSRMFEEAARVFDGNGCKAGCFVGNIALEMSDVSEEFRLRAGRFFSEWVESMSGCLRRAKAMGIFDAGLAPRSVAEAVISLYEGAMMQARVRRDPHVLRRAGVVARSILAQYRSAEAIRHYAASEKASRRSAKVVNGG